MSDEVAETMQQPADSFLSPRLKRTLAVLAAPKLPHLDRACHLPTLERSINESHFWCSRVWVAAMYVEGVGRGGKRTAMYVWKARILHPGIATRADSSTGTGQAQAAGQTMRDSSSTQVGGRV